MLEMNNTFLLVGLVIVAITCIYLLYASFNTPDLNAFKNTVNNMVQQNKKRDEIVNFLLDKVQGLNNLVVSLQNGNGANVETTHTTQNQNIDDLLDTALSEGDDNEYTYLTDDDKMRLDTLEEVANLDTLDPEEVNPDADTLDPLEVNPDANTLDPVEVNPDVADVVDDELMNNDNSEFESVMSVVQNSKLDDSIPVVKSSEDKQSLDIVDNVMNELSVVGLSVEDKAYLKKLPKDKDSLASLYNTKDLKDMCKRFNLSMYGKKTELAERILALR